MDKPFFLSHSSQDKVLVRELAKELGKELCWLDEWELGGGADLLSTIDSALESGSTKLFVLFWSAAASESPWVHEEMANARLRKLRRNDIRIVPIRIDDTPMPLWMGRLVYFNAGEGIPSIAPKIRELLSADTISTDLPFVDPAFQNRTNEADAFERAYHNPEVGAVIISGLQGIGKSALCRFILGHRLPHLRTLWVDLAAANSPALFYAALAERSGVRLPKSVLESASWHSYWRDWLLPTVAEDSDILVLDGLNLVFGPEGLMPGWLQVPIDDNLKRAGANRLPLVIITSKLPEFAASTERRIVILPLPKLSDADIIRTLRHRLASAFPRRHAEQDQLERAAEIVSGYPLGAQLWAAYAARVGVELAVIDPSPVQKQLQTLVADIISGCQLKEEELRALLLLALARFPLSPNDLLTSLKVAPGQLQALQRSMLLEPGVSGLAVHGLVGGYLVNNLSSHDVVKKAHSELGQFFLTRWKESGEDLAKTAALAGQAYFHLTAAGKTAEAAVISWSVVEEVRSAVAELYRTQQDDKVVEVAESIFALGKKDPQIAFYYALALGRRRSSDDEMRKAIGVFRQLLADHPNNGYYWVGFGDVLSRSADAAAAKEAYLKARALRRNDPVPSQKIGELLLRQSDLVGAETFLREALRRAPNESRVMASLASLLQRKGQHSEALQMVREGLLRRPDDIPLNHRAGLILREMGKSIDALPHLTRAATGDALPASYITLADLYLEMGRTRKAKEVLAKYPGSKSPGYYNLKGNIDRLDKRFSEAEECFERCRKMAGEDIVLLGSIAHLKIAQAEEAIGMRATEEAMAYVVEAEEALRKGFVLEPDNEPLLRLRREAEKMRVAVRRSTLSNA